MVATLFLFYLCIIYNNTNSIYIAFKFFIFLILVYTEIKFVLK